MKHITVLLNEGVDALALNADSIVVDATHGAGGHGKLICEKLDDRGVYIGIDADSTALAESPLKGHKGGPSIHLIQNNFAHLEEVVSSLHISQV